MKSPAEISAGLLTFDMPIDFGSVADPDRLVGPAIAVPVALTLPVAARRRGRGAFVIGGAGGRIVDGGRAAGGDGAADEGAADQAGGKAGADAVMRLRGRRAERAGDRRDRKQRS